MTRSFSGSGRTWARWWIFAVSYLTRRGIALLSKSARRPGRRRIPLTAMAVLGTVCMLFSMQAVSVHAQDHWIEVNTPRFQVEAVDQHAAQASWYAGFVEQ